SWISFQVRFLLNAHFGGSHYRKLPRVQYRGGERHALLHFVNEAVRRHRAHILRDQCVEHFGAQEAYYPVFDALGRAAKEIGMVRFLTVLRRYAPTWLGQMPGVERSGDREALKQETLGATRERMLREMTEAIEVFATQEPLIFVLEDLHWS